MKTRVILSLAAIVLLAGCNKEIDAPEVNVTPNGGEVYTLRLGTPETITKTTLGEVSGNQRKVYWSDGDKIAVNGNESNPLSGVEAKCTEAEFTFASAQTAPYNILYPSSIWKDANTVTLPDTQNYVADTFADGVLPMAGYSADGMSATLSYLCAVIKVPLKKSGAEKADADDIVSVSFSSNGSEKVCGDFTIDYPNAALSGGTGSKISMALNKSLSAETPLNVYLVVPALTYASGFSVTITDENNHEMVQSASKSVTLQAGHIYNLEEVAFTPDLSLAINISSASQLVAFASAYNSGEYDAYDLVVNLTSNISFNSSSSSSFAATGGIGTKEGINGTSDNYFHGVFNGNNKTISGYTGGKPIFCATGEVSTIKDLKIDNSCSYTFTHPGTADGQFGTVVGYHKGIMKNVTVNAPITLAAADGVASETCLGGLVGRMTIGTIENCAYTGAITVPADFSSAGAKIQIGGLVGRISNKAGEVKNSSFSGTIDNQGQMVAPEESNEYKKNPYLMIGGIVGLNSGSVTSCTTVNHETGITVTLNDGSDHDYTGTVVTHSVNAYNYAIAGIAGRNDGTVTACTNNANVVNIFSAERGASGNMNGRYLHVGGIAGFNGAEGVVTGSNNFGTIIDRATPKMHFVGGIVGTNNGAVSNCENKSTDVQAGTAHFSPYGARMIHIGGVVGISEAGSSVSSVSNTANITVSRIENTTGTITTVGGVVGTCNVDLDGSAGAISNSGKIYQTNGVRHCATPTDDNDYGRFLGGIVGYSTAGVKSVSNSGDIEYKCTATGVGDQYVHLGGVAGKVKAAEAASVEKCSNTGNVTFNASATFNANSETKYYYNCLGGIVGMAVNVAIKGTSANKCTNSGTIKGGDGSANNNLKVPSFCIGGIVGKITGVSSIAYCSLAGSALVHNDHWSNRGSGSYDCPVSGGIAGQIIGEDGKFITLSNCDVASTASVVGRRGAVGGIVGAAQYATLSNCSVPIDFPTSYSAFFFGGIVALAQYTSVNNCTYSGSTIQSSQMQLGGGIVGLLDAGSSVAGCSSYAVTIDKNGTAITAFGGIAGSSVESSEIASCHYKSSIQICSDANYTDGGGNAADL